MAMREYPKDFTTRLINVESHVKPQAQEAAVSLRNISVPPEDSYGVYAGLTRWYGGSIALMAQQSHIAKYCPEDATSERFATFESTRRWLSESRAVFLLLKQVDDKERQLAGYGWAAPGPMGAKTEFALRIGQEDRRKRLAVAFGHLIIAGAAEIYGAQDFWAEVDESSVAGLKMCKRLGFEELNYLSQPCTEELPAIEPLPHRRVGMILPYDKAARLL